MDKPKLFTMGYQGHKPADMLALVERMNAIVLDIRYSASSPNPSFTLTGFRTLLGSRYELCKDFGNVNYRGDGPIVLVDYTHGIRRVMEIAAKHPGKPLILMCGCHSPANCHRSVVARFLTDDGFSVSEVTWDKPQPSLFGGG